MMAIDPIFVYVMDWWLRIAERHYLICAESESAIAREALLNAAYYHKQAAVARSARSHP